MDAWVFPMNRGFNKAILFDAYQVRDYSGPNTFVLPGDGFTPLQLLKNEWAKSMTEPSPGLGLSG